MAIHCGDAGRIGAQRAQCVGKEFAVSGLDDYPAIMPTDQLRDFTGRRGDGNDRPPRGGNPIELARYNQSFELRLQRNQVDVGNTKGKLQEASFLIRQETK